MSGGWGDRERGGRRHRHPGKGGEVPDTAIEERGGAVHTHRTGALTRKNTRQSRGGARVQRGATPGAGPTTDGKSMNGRVGRCRNNRVRDCPRGGLRVLVLGRRAHLRRSPVWGVRKERCLAAEKREREEGLGRTCRGAIPRGLQEDHTARPGMCTGCVAVSGVPLTFRWCRRRRRRVQP